MTPFRMFFGLAIGIMLFIFLAKVVFFAFIFAAIMSFIYAIYRRIRDFVTYDHYGAPYMNRYNRSNVNYHYKHKVEPLFYEHTPKRYTKYYDAYIVKIS